MKNPLIVLIILLLTSNLLFAQKSDSLIIDTQLQTNRIKENLTKYDTTTIQIWDQSSEGGQITGYYENKELKLIEIIFYGESGKSQLEYFFNKRELIFALDQQFSYNRPIYWNEESAKMNNDDEVYDDEKTIVTSDSYYFKNEKLIWWLDNDLNEIDLTLGTNSIVGQGLISHCYKMIKEYKL